MSGSADDRPVLSDLFQLAYDHHIQEIDDEVERLRTAIGDADRYAGLRERNLRGNTTSPNYRVKALKSGILTKLRKLGELTKKMAPILVELRLAELELAFMLQQQRRKAEDDWRRIADGGVYEGAKHFLDMLFDNHQIGTYALGSFDSREIGIVANQIKTLLAERKTP